VPAPHMAHALESVAAVALVEEPPGQKTQALEVVWPGLGLYLPSGHAVHSVWPKLGLKRPGGQVRHSTEDGLGL